MTRPRRHPIIAGFTLVELLVVICIVAILASILATSVSSVSRAGKNARCISNLRQLHAAISAYTTEHNGEFPPSYASPWAPGMTGERDWYQYLFHADLSKADNKGVLPNPNFSANDPRKLTVYQCPANPDRIWDWHTPNYAYSQALGYTSGNINTRARISNLEQPSKTIVLVDAGVRGSRSSNSGPPQYVCFVTTFGGSTFYWQKSVNFLHGNHANFLLADGHVESLTRDEVNQRGNDLNLLWSPDNIYGSYWGPKN